MDEYEILLNEKMQKDNEAFVMETFITNVTLGVQVRFDVSGSFFSCFLAEVGYFDVGLIKRGRVHWVRQCYIGTKIKGLNFDGVIIDNQNYSGVIGIEISSGEIHRGELSLA